MENTINPQLPFAKGINAILKIRWTLKTQAPLVIRQGIVAEFKSDRHRTEDNKKGRKIAPSFKWLPGGAENQVADFAFQFVVDENGSLQPRYHIPPSSIRGALRAAAIERWVDWQQRDLFTLQKKAEDASEEETSALIAKVNQTCEAMRRNDSKWMQILSLFGIAFNPQNDPANPYTWAGRLQVETAPLKMAGGEKIKYAGHSFDTEGGPTNMQRRIGMRTPVDRITGGAKETGGGIHHWVEMPKGQTFDVCLTISNPCQTDIDLIDDWRTRINAGFLTIGGLSSVGRGEVKFDGEHYDLYSHKSELEDFDDDPLEMIWECEPLENFDDLLILQDILPVHNVPKPVEEIEEGEQHGQ